MVRSPRRSPALTTYTPKQLTRLWTAYEKLLAQARRVGDSGRLDELADARAELEAEIGRHKGLVRVANVFWFGGRMLQPGQPVRVRIGGAVWRSGLVGQYANRVELQDGSTVRLLDVDQGGELELDSSGLSE